MSVTKLVTPKFRVSFPCVFEAKSAFDGQPKRYSLTMLFDKAALAKDPEQKKLFDAMIQAVKDAAREKWGDKIPANLRNPFRNGKEKEQFQGYGEGVVFVVTTSQTRPGLVNNQLQPIIEAEEFYAGCYARATVNAYAYEKMGNAGVSFGLHNIQKLGDGEPFSGRTKPEQDFDAIDQEIAAAGKDNALDLFA